MTSQEQSAMAARLWRLQAELLTAATELSGHIAGDDMLARTLGDEGEFIEYSVAGACRKVRAVCLRLDRTISEKTVSF